MNDSERYDEVCSKQFQAIHEKLDSLIEKLITGNGQPSLMVRVDRLEQCKQSVSKAFWMAVSSVIGLIFLGIKDFFFNHK